MANPTAGTPAPATIAGTTPAKGVPNHRPTPPRRLAAEPEPITAFDVLERLDSIGLHWWSLIDGVLTSQVIGSGRTEPVPQWALETLQDQGRHQAAYDEYTQQLNCLKELLRLSEGRGSAKRYEVWSKGGARLSLRNESVGEAMTMLEYWKKQPGYENARVMSVHVMNINSLATDPALLETMVGQVRMAGCVFPTNEAEARIEIQDETGRTVMLPASTLRGHAICERVTNRDSLDAWLKESDDRPARRHSSGGGQ